MAPMPAGTAADFSEAQAGPSTIPPKDRPPLSRASTSNRKDTILSLVELLLQQENQQENLGQGAYLSYPVYTQ